MTARLATPPRPLAEATRSLLIVGAGGHAKVVADIARLTGWVVAGFADDVSPDRRGTEFCGATIVGGREALSAFVARGIHFVVAIGDCDARARIVDQLCGEGVTLATLRHPSAVLAGDVVVGEGTVIAAGAIVNAGSRVGRGVIVNTAATIDHDGHIGDAAHIGPGAHLGGRVTVGQTAWIGIGVVVRDRVSIGARAIVGAGAVVVSDIPDAVVAYGVPARVVRPVS